MKTGLPKVTTKEAQIQAAAEELCMIKGIPFIRLPDTLMKAVFANPRVSGKDKAFISSFLKGIPDLILFNPNTMIYKAIEIKTEAGKLSKAQREWTEKLNTTVTVGMDETLNAIKEFANV